MLQQAFSMRLVLRPPSFWIPIWAPMQCDVALFVPYRPVDSAPFGRIFINHKAKVVINSDKTMTLNGLFCGIKEPTSTRFWATKFVYRTEKRAEKNIIRRFANWDGN